jgi:hypothetical protein
MIEENGGFMTEERIANTLENIEEQITFIQMELPTLRDQFAMAAITGILAGKWGQMPQYKPEEAFADFAYRMADAMMKRSEQSE